MVPKLDRIILNKTHHCHFVFVYVSESVSLSVFCKCTKASTIGLSFKIRITWLVKNHQKSAFCRRSKTSRIQSFFPVQDSFWGSLAGLCGFLDVDSRQLAGGYFLNKEQIVNITLGRHRHGRFVFCQEATIMEILSTVLFIHALQKSEILNQFAPFLIIFNLNDGLRQTHRVWF